jgi:phage shock protein PspC (stress-responsive transcriptional regulator)
MKRENALRRLARSAGDRWVAGVCGGFGEHTPVPAWIWRPLFLAAVLLHGAGLILYALLWLFMPAPRPEATARKGRRPGLLRRLARSGTDRRLGGVCGGLGENTAVPAWCWRIGFVCLVPLNGAGVLLYAALWIFMPKPLPAAGNTGRPALATGR